MSAAVHPWPAGVAGAPQEQPAPERRGEPGPRIVLYGIGGAYNYGCEAIIRGTEQILHERWPGAAIVYLSPQPADDARRLAGCRITIEPRVWYSRYHPRKWAARMARLVRAPVLPNTENLAAFAGAGAVLSIGGDMYTLGFERGRFPRWLVSSGELALRMGRPFVVWGASIGPLEANPNARRLILRHLRRVSLITVREPSTEAYLAAAGITRNVVACADPAFVVNQLPAEPVPPRPCRQIGVNYSPLSAAYAGADAGGFLHAQAAALAELSRRCEAGLLLIPHVVCGAAAVDDDLRYALKLREAAAALAPRPVSVAGTDPGYRGLRDALLSCDLVVAARMHCAINALSLGVPALFVGYSAKAAGMARYVYGDDRWVLPVDATAGSRVAAAAAGLLAAAPSLRALLRQRVPEIQRDARRAVRALEPLLP